MLSIRLYEHYDFSTRPVIPPARPRRPYHDLLMSFISSTSFTAVVILMPCFLASPASASPILDTPLQSRALGSGDGSQSLSPKIWVPILIVILVLFSIAAISWYKGRGLRFFNFAGSAAAASGAPITGGTRELTAEQLAGTINNGAANNTTAAGTTGGTRRPRRPRRTPSQISTTSLPAYNKEPGDEELVIFRGPQDMEDAGMPTAIVMPSVDEDGEASIHTGDHSQVSRYSPMPTSPNSMPLLHDEFSGDLSMQSLQPPPGEDMPRRSYETINSSHETSSLMRIETSISEQESDPRGEAPAYFEVVDNAVDLSSPPRSSSNPNAPTIPSASSPPSSPERNTQRRSGFRSLLNRMTVAGSHHAQSSSHARADSGHSIVTTSHRRDGSSARASHRPSQSSSGSMFRTLSRQKSNTTLNSNRLNSPSLISLNSISPPLTHTAVRSEFTYPKAGPTPEQLKLISSRESFARFGMPYGADAIAFAASASRQDLEPPPPDFDAAGSESHLPRSAGPSRLRSTSNAADSQESGDGSGSSLSDGDHSHSERSPSPRISPERERTTTSSNTEPTNSILTTAIPAIHNTQTSNESNLPSVTPEATADDTHNSTSSAASPPPATPIVLPPTSMLSAPPSSFHPPSPLVRSESRASSFSMQSFATAEESLSASTPLASPSRADLSQISGPPTPTTPKMGGLHVLEATDVTITHPGNVTAPATSVQA